MLGSEFANLAGVTPFHTAQAAVGPSGKSGSAGRPEDGRGLFSIVGLVCGLSGFQGGMTAVRPLVGGGCR